MPNFLAKLFNILSFRDPHFRELLTGSSTALFLKLGSVASVYLFNFAIARVYGADGNGLFSFCYTLLNILIIVGLFGLETYLIRYIAEYAYKGFWGTIRLIYNKALLLTCFITAILSVILYFVFPWIMQFVGQSGYTAGLQITAIALLPATILRLNSEALKGLKKIKYYSLLQNVSILAVALAGFGVLEVIYPQEENILWAFLIGQLLIMGWSFYLWKKETEGSPLTPEFTISAGKILNTSIPFLLASTIFYLMNWTDKIMLGIMATQTELGIYEITLKIGQMAGLILFAINTIAAPKFSEFYSQNEMEQFRKFTQQTTAVVILATLPVMLIILLFPELLLSIFGKEFLAGKTCLYLLTFAAFVTSATGSVVIILNMTGKQKTSQYILLSVAIVNVVLNYFFIPLWGINGTAFATLISNTLWNGLGMIFIYRYYGFWTVKFKTILNPLNPR